MTLVVSIALWAAAALTIWAMLVWLAAAVNRRTRFVDMEKKEIDMTALRRWLNDYEIALQRHLDQEKRRPTKHPRC